MLRIFVSHCAKHDARSKTVVDHLLHALPDSEIELVWDRDLLQVGDDWDDKLLDEMDRCDGAILLLSETALTRSYVVKECTILAQRKRYSEKWGGNTFELLSVLVGIKPEDLSDAAKSHMKDLNLGKYQAGSDDDLTVLVSALRSPLDRLKLACRRGTPRQGLLVDIAIQIRSGKPGSDTKLADKLDVSLPAWIVHDASPEVRALAIAAQMPDKKLRAIGRALSETKDEIDLPSALAIIERVATFSVPGEAAALIPQTAADVTKPRALEVNADDIRVGKWYTRLAYGSMLVTQTADVTNADSGLGAERLLQEITACILDKVSAVTIEEAKDELADIGVPFFVFVLCKRPVVDVLKKIHNDFPTVTIVFLTGAKTTPAAPQQPSPVVFLQPLLADQQEQMALARYMNTIKEVKNAHAR